MSVCSCLVQGQDESMGVRCKGHGNRMAADLSSLRPERILFAGHSFSIIPSRLRQQRPFGLRSQLLAALRKR